MRLDYLSFITVPTNTLNQLGWKRYELKSASINLGTVVKRIKLYNELIANVI